MRAPGLVLACAASVALMACSVIDDGKVSRIDPPGGLDDTVPTTEPTSTTDSTPTSAVNSSTTLVQTEPVRLYFIASGQLVYLTVQINSPAELPVIISALQLGPPGETFGLRTALPQGATIIVRSDGSGVAEVDLPDDFFDQVSQSDQRLVIGQIVLTLTDSRGIGQVVFDQPVLKPLGEQVDPGEPLTRRDYESLAGSGPLPADEAAGATATVTSTGGG